jgi:hypothetical protein
MRQGQEVDRALVYVELLKVEHARTIGRSHPPVASSLTAWITPTTSFPFTSAATITGASTITITITITITTAMVSEPGARHCQSCAGNMGIEAASARAPHAPG